MVNCIIKKGVILSKIYGISFLSTVCFDKPYLVFGRKEQLERAVLFHVLAILGCHSKTTIIERSVGTLSGLGSGHVPRPLQQRVLRAVPPAPRADPLQLGRQERPRLGHGQAQLPQHVPPGTRPLLGHGRTSDPQPLRWRYVSTRFPC